MLKKKILIIITIFYVFYLGILPFVMTSALSCFSKNGIRISGYNMEVSKPRIVLSLLPVVIFEAKKITVIDKKLVTKTVGENVRLRIRILPLLSGRLHINCLNLDSLEFVTTLNQSLELDKDFFNQLEFSKVKIDSINIKSYRFLFFHNGVDKPICYSGKDFLLKNHNRYFRLNLLSSLQIFDQVSDTKINLFLPKNNDINKTIFEINISNFDLAPLRVYLKHYLPRDIIELKGSINAQANKGRLITEFKNCSLLMKEASNSIILPKELVVKSKFDINRQNIIFENINIDSQSLHMILQGKVSNYFSKTKPSLDLNLQINKSRVEDFVNMLPAFEIEELDVYKLKKYKFYGDVIGNISIKGRLPEPDIVGEVYINDGVLQERIPNTKSGATIKLKMLGRHIGFDVVVPAGGTEKVWVNGTQEIYNVKHADLVVKSTEKVDLNIAQKVVNPLHEILNFVIGPVPILDINGFGNINISVKGTRKFPHVWGVMNFLNSNVSFIDVPDLKLVGADAKLVFNDEVATFSNSTGSVNGKSFAINGDCSLQGKFDFSVKSNDQSSNSIIQALKSSTMVPDIKKMIPNFENIAGALDLDLKIYGELKDIEDLAFNENVFASGEIRLKDNSFNYQHVPAKQINGNVKFTSTTSYAQLVGLIGDSNVDIKAVTKKDFGDISIRIPKFDVNLLIPDLELSRKKYLPKVSLVAKYRGNIENIEFDKLEAQVEVLGSDSKSKIKFYPNGKIILSNGILIVKNLRGYIGDVNNVLQSDLRITNLFTKKINANGNVRVKSPDLSLINELLVSDIFPENISSSISNVKFNRGALDLDCKFINNKLSLYSDLGGISLIYLPQELPIEIINGTLSVRNNILKLNKINLLLDKMPVLIDGDVKDLFEKQSYDLYINSKPQQEFIDKYVNKNQIYPIKIKGDIVYWAKLKGVLSSFDLKTKIDMSKDSSIYHYGATIGDLENAISIYLDSKINNSNILKIKEFSYNKIIDSQSGKQTSLNLLRAYGGVEILKDNLVFNNLVIKTSHPTDARIFNIIFRKPNIKQGQFTSDLKLDGSLNNPKIVGNFHIFETNIPFLDTMMKNIEFIFKDKVIEVTSKGDILGNDVSFTGVFKNKLTIPYQIEKAILHTKDLDLNRVLNKFKISEVDNVSTFESFEGFDLNSIVFNNFKLKADNIQLRNIRATDFESVASLNNKGVFDVENFVFNIAQGTLSGKYRYNLDTEDVGLRLHAESIDANDITWALFDLNDQIYGDMTGDVSLTCNGADFHHCMETLSGSSKFSVKNGRMPKLGSLEYLLKAGNLVKGGLTGLSINSVIDLISPLKTGDFSDIKGNIRIKDGVARRIEISTRGKDLSLYIAGTYNFATSIADMEVLGLLSRKISTMFGPIGNMSINTLFNIIPGVDLSQESPILEKINKIPGIELTSKAYRRFIAEIKGNINGDNYVTSFKWIN